MKKGITFILFLTLCSNVIAQIKILSDMQMDDYN